MSAHFAVGVDSSWLFVVCKKNTVLGIRSGCNSVPNVLCYIFDSFFMPTRLTQSARKPKHTYSDLRVGRVYSYIGLDASEDRFMDECKNWFKFKSFQIISVYV